MEKGLLHKQIMDFFVRNFDVSASHMQGRPRRGI